ncbi:Hsp70 family protein [Haloarchaeobius iranensis]|uniref:Hsp70 protein n=1 Tax=Haloarchaeobius iranensis TaxID=996166 RepID=A0A1H0A2K4_9EURY|nr:Hsp70 family protein [Haloarchaeobius iranensis]SDN28042.1 Hsp70 protein [Haloarchaeobius iranensis]
MSYLGIDLGTTRSGVAVVEADDPTLLQNNAGDRLTPSVVYYRDDDDDVLVGKPAKNKQKEQNDRIVTDAKRRMGDDHVYAIDGEEYTPAAVSSEVLKQLKDDAEEFEDDISGAHITVPAYFTVDQKGAVREAAEIAGFDEIDLLHEPTAAAIGHGFDQEMNETVFVYDFGGGTLDISLMDVEGNSFDILATSGDTTLGGIDFTEAIMDLLADEFEQNNGIDLRSDPEARESLRAEAEQAKIDLSGREETEISAPLLGQIDDEVVGITERVLRRSEFESAASGLLDRAIDPVEDALKKADMDAEDVDTVLLVGGSSKIPAVQEQLTDFFGFEPTKTNDLAKVVAKGAAIVADLEDGIDEKYVCPECPQGFDYFDDLNDHLSTHDPDDGIACPYCDEVLDTKGDREDHIGLEHPGELGSGGEEGGKYPTGKKKILSRSLGTDLVGARMDILIEEGSELPATATERYVPTADDPEQIPVHVYQGEDVENLYSNEKLKDWYVEDIPETESGRPTIAVTFEIDDDGLLEVSAELVDSDKSVSTTVDRITGSRSNGTSKGPADDD